MTVKHLVDHSMEVWYIQALHKALLLCMHVTWASSCMGTSLLYVLPMDNGNIQSLCALVSITKLYNYIQVKKGFKINAKMKM